MDKIRTKIFNFFFIFTQLFIIFVSFWLLLWLLALCLEGNWEKEKRAKIKYLPLFIWVEFKERNDFSWVSYDLTSIQKYHEIGLKFAHTKAKAKWHSYYFVMFCSFTKQAIALLELWNIKAFVLSFSFLLCIVYMKLLVKQLWGIDLTSFSYRHAILGNYLTLFIDYLHFSQIILVHGTTS